MKLKCNHLALLSLFFSLSVDAADFSSAWFQPDLRLNEAAVCEDLVNQTIELWSGNTDQAYPSSLAENGYYRNGQVRINGQLVYLRSYTHTGCGGACDRYQLLASKDPFPKKRENRDFYKSLFSESPPAVDRFYFLTSRDGKYYVLTPNRDLDQLYELTEQASWRLVCSVNKKPSKEQIEKTEPDYGDIQSSLKELRGLVGGLRRGAGSCGTMKTHWRWSKRIDDEFQRLLYAPRLEPKLQGYNVSSVYDENMTSLELWSLQGLSEFEALTSYKNKLPLALEKLSGFYQKNFNWKKEKAEGIANYALKYATSAGIRFNEYHPFRTREEADLRRAILQKKPIDAIKRINIPAIIKASQKRIWRDNNESILNVAVTYPEALSYLLNHGFDPNKANVFGKTPLMYAAQYNDYASAKILIESGAKVNTGTIIPNDTCFYTLRTSNMSPLHYAVRYANQELIEMLLENGASKYFDARIGHGYYNNIERPIDWLTKYVNDNLPAEKKTIIKHRLKLPEQAELEKLAENLNLQGEKLYSEGKFEAASEAFKEAVRVDSENIRALNNLAITSLKINDRKRSIQASKRVVESKTSTKKQKASAYFNIGLACEEGGFRFDGRKYCRQNTLAHFVKAYQTYPTKSRANAIVERFVKRDKYDRSCKSDKGRFEYAYKRRKDFHFLHKQPMEDSIADTEFLFSRKNTFAIERKKFILTRKETTDLQNGYSISTYKSDIPVGETFVFNEGLCTVFSSKLLSEKSKLVYILAAKNQKEIDIEFNLNEAYTIILSGDVEWRIHEVGSKKADFIINNGRVSDDGALEYTLIKDMHKGWSSNTRKNQHISLYIRSQFGKPVYTTFRIFSSSKITINDQDINRPKLIVSSFPVLDFYGIGSYQIAFTEPKKAFNNFMNLEKIQFVSNDKTQLGRKDTVYVQDIADFIDNSENFYFEVEKWRRGAGRYFGGGYFSK